ncbi:hypothetical protein [Breoghania sp.]|uniref:hypothetical protein n=1 Tax=Breoghania sp. TaxID=2065378 RepID=UPI002616C90C|nr:hypothetical protein [Breoghania sp.]MDJ0931408.1 hypothetical protein [Breoghania sp.]
MPPALTTVLKIAALAAMAAGLASCRDHEQGRPLHYEQGTYGGKADTPLTEEQQRALRLRGRMQGM